MDTATLVAYVAQDDVRIFVPHDEQRARLGPDHGVDDIDRPTLDPGPALEAHQAQPAIV
jgi:hypothetical protein